MEGGLGLTAALPQLGPGATEALPGLQCALYHVLPLVFRDLAGPVRDAQGGKLHAGHRPLHQLHMLWKQRRHKAASHAQHRAARKAQPERPLPASMGMELRLL